MSFHLEGPWLTTTGKLKSKRRKFASADAARKSRELAQEWEQRNREWAKLAPKFSTGQIQETAKPPRLSPAYPPGREPQRHIPSLDTGLGVASLPAQKVYTGTKVKGIGTLHKSNAVPIFSDEEAVAIAHMRR
jgi:hypothetical protein